MTTTVTLLEYSWDTRLVGSVIAADATATTYSIGCPSSQGQGTTCFDYKSGVPAITVVGGPSTAAQTLAIKDIDLTVVVTCKLTATAPYGGSCERTDRSGSLTFKTSFDPTAKTEFATFAPVVVTGGLEKLEQPGPTGSGSAASGTPTSPTGTGTGTGTGAVNGPTNPGSSGSTKSFSTSLCGCVFGVGMAVFLYMW